MYDNVDFEMSLAENVLQEDLGVLRNIENFEYNVESWRKGDVRALFLSGLSGSGKTTYGRTLAAENGATMRSLDKYLKPMLRVKYGPFTSEQYHRAVYDHGVSELLADNPDGRFVFEGGQICWMNPDELKDHAVIIVGTSFATSTWRAILRDFSKDHWEEYGHIAPHVHTAFNLKTFQPLRSMIRQLRSSEE
jgi:hypothetical protein